MVDFVKINIKNLNPSILEENPLLNFYDNINLTTGEIKTTNRNGIRVTPCKIAFYNGLEFKIYDTGTITLSGSLHKYNNKGVHNYDDFNNEAVLLVLRDLKAKFDIEPSQCILKCLEIGINIDPPIPTNEILDNCFLHMTKPFEYQKNSYDGKYKQVKHSQYIIKIYNKALHYRSKGLTIPNEIMRFEIKYTKMEKLNSKGIYNLQDLVDYGLHNFKKDLIIEWQRVLFFDKTIQFDQLNTKLQRALLEYSNPNYWTVLLNSRGRKNFTHHKNNLKKITANTSDRIQDKITEIMSKKVDQLNTKAIQIDPLIILSERIVIDNRIEGQKMVCKVTGVDISMQKDNSILLSHTGLKHYHKTNYKLFEQIKRDYLSALWNHSDFETQIREIAHNIRNKNRNQTNKQDGIYQQSQINLLSQLKI